MKKKGLLFVLVGPSGSGKNTILAEVLKRIEDLEQMPTGTTRLPRPEEIQGQQHFFFSEEDFDQLVEQGAFLEWQLVHGKRYGTLRSSVEERINAGRDSIADLEVLGASSLKECYPENIILIFILPPSMEILEERIRQRGLESDEEIRARIGRAEFEISFMEKCDYVVKNENFEIAVEQLKQIIIAERSRKDFG